MNVHVSAQGYIDCFALSQTPSATSKAETPSFWKKGSGEGVCERFLTVEEEGKEEKRLDEVKVPNSQFCSSLPFIFFFRMRDSTTESISLFSLFLFFKCSICW